LSLFRLLVEVALQSVDHHGPLASIGRLPGPGAEDLPAVLHPFAFDAIRDLRGVVSCCFCHVLTFVTRFVRHLSGRPNAWPGLEKVASLYRPRASRPTHLLYRAPNSFL